MTRLRSLIKEVLSQPKKKDCGCGCNTCGDKAPILTEGKFKSLISEGLQHHIDKKISLFESVYRMGSEKHLELIREARALWIRGIIEVSDDDKGLLETHLGHFGLYEGVEVPLDLPMVNEEVNNSDLDNAVYRLENVLKYLDIEYKETIRGEKYVQINYIPVTSPQSQNPEFVNVRYNNDEDLEIIKNRLDLPMLNEEKDRAKEIMRDLFGLDFEFDYTYKPEGDRIIIHPEGYNPDGTLFDMKDVHKEKIIGTFQDKMPKAHAQPNMGGGITVNLKESLNENNLLRQTNLSSEEYQKAKKLKGFNADDYTFSSDNNLYVKKSSLKEAAVDYDFSKEELIRVIKQLKRGASTEVGMIKAFEKALGRELTDDEIRGFKLNEAKKKNKSKKKDPPLNKPKRGGSKAYYVYVRDPKTKKIKKVSFGSGGLRAKIKNKEARNAFAARHNCKNKKDRTKAGYWSCNLPRYAEQLGLGSKMNTFW